MVATQARIEIDEPQLEWQEGLTFDPHDPRLPTNHELMGPDPDSDLVESIRAQGIRYRLQLRQHPGYPDKLEVLDGGRRLKAARKLGLAEVKADLTVTDLPTAEILALQLHSTRRANPIAEFEWIRRLESSGITDDGELARRTGLPVQTLNKRRELARLDPTLRTAVASGKIKYSVVESVVRLGAGYQQRCVEQYLSAGRLTHNDVKAIRQTEAEESWGQLDGLFGEGNEPIAHDWRQDVLALLRQAYEAIPQDDAPEKLVNKIRAAITLAERA